jgi:hypothetical protein
MNHTSKGKDLMMAGWEYFDVSRNWKSPDGVYFHASQTNGAYQYHLRLIEIGYYRQILQEALRIINELHLSGGVRYNEEWLAKANAFMNGNAESPTPAPENEAPPFLVGETETGYYVYNSRSMRVKERFEDEDNAREYASELNRDEYPKPQAVTLTTEEIDWFAKHYTDHDEFRLMPEEGYVDWLDNKAVRFFTSLTKDSLYELREAYNTPANHAAIAKRRDELKGE